MASEAATTTPPFSFEAFNRLGTSQKIGLMVAVALTVALIVVGVQWSRTADYGVLFAGLSERDGGQIITVLQQQNIPYKMSEGGGAILVPAAQVYDTRLKLASQGLPRGGLVGFEVMETQKLGASQFLEQVNYQRALEGELARSVQSLQAVRGARVHLAIPRQTAFLRDEQKPTASVLVNLYPGRVLEAGQVAGIVHLISSSVPQLTPSSVSVIDQDGNLISQAQDPSRNAGLDATQLKYVHELEQSYIKRIETIIATVVGPGNVRAQVAAAVDFTQTEQVAESYKPNPAPNTSIRSQQSSESSSSSGAAGGVPGALSNQPPVPATAPITTPPVGGVAGGAAGQPSNLNKNSTINFELDKTVLHTTGAPGIIKRLSVAVVVNHKDAGKGKPVPLTDAEMKQINDLTREAMGFTKERGDTLNVANAPFSAAALGILPETPFWKDPEIIGWAREIGKYLILAIAAFLLWTRLLKPLFEQLSRAPTIVTREPALAMAGGGTEEPSVAAQQAQDYESKVERARQVAKDDPKLVANVIKDWIGSNEQR
jgi:flagellar M-ring protein FliF